MTQDDIIEMARQKKFIFNHENHVFWGHMFSAFVVADVLFILCTMCLELAK